MSDDHIYRVLKLLVWIVGRIPVGIADFCSDLFGLIWFRIDRRHRRIALTNLTHCFGSEMSRPKIEAMGKQAFKNIAAIFFEVAWSVKFSKDTFLSHFTIKGLDHIRKAHARGKGVIVVTCHMGNFEMLIPAIDETGLKGYAIYRSLDFKPLDRLIRNTRQRFGVTMIPTIGASKRIKQVLARGGVVGTLLDQNTDCWNNGIFVDFFGRPACTHPGLAGIAMDAGAPVVPMYTIRKNRKFIIEFLPEIPVSDTGDRIKDIETNTQNYVSAVEAMVRKCPEQYFWVHNRWKTKNYGTWPQITE